MEYIHSQGDESASQEMTKAELLEIFKNYFKSTKTEIQEIVEAYGHTVVYLPPITQS